MSETRYTLLKRDHRGGYHGGGLLRQGGRVCGSIGRGDLEWGSEVISSLLGRFDVVSWKKIPLL